MDPALNQNEPELGISVLPVPLKMLPDGDGLLDQVVAILGQLRSHALALQDTEDLVAGNETDLDELKVKASKFISLITSMRWYCQRIVKIPDTLRGLKCPKSEPGTYLI